MNIRISTARVRSDSRALQAALEQYKKETGSYPPTGSPISHLTTPVAYISNWPSDDFATTAAADQLKTLLSYYTTADHFLIWSVGPDKKSDIDPIADLPGAPQTIILKTYDATNGTASPGDIIRTNVPLR